MAAGPPSGASMSNSGRKTNIKGRKKPTREERKACIAVAIIGAPAMELAAKAASATGGVTMESMPK